MAEKNKQERKVYIYPAELPLDEGLIFRIELQEPLKTSEIDVFLGDQLINKVIIHGPDLIYCRTQEAKPGSQDLIIKSGKEVLLKVDEAVLRSRTPQTKTPGKHPKGGGEKGPTGSDEKEPGMFGPASNWWMKHQDLQHTSNARSVKILRLNPFWRREFEGFFDLTQPIFAPGLVLIGCGFGGGEAFAALDITNGESVWTRLKSENGNRFVLGNPVAIDGKVAFVEESTDDIPAHVTCLDFTNGEMIWSHPLPVSWTHSSLASAFGMIYGASQSGRVVALDLETGQMRWERPIEVGPGAMLSSPALMFGSVYVGSREGPRVFDAANGNPGWSAATPNNGTATPSIVTAVNVGDPAVVAIGAADNSLYGFHAGSGQQLWRFDGDLPLTFTTPASSEDGKYYLRQNHSVVALDIQTGVVINSSQNFDHNVINGPTLTKNGVLIVIDSDQGNQLTLLDRQTFSVLDSKPVGRVHSGDHGAPSVIGRYVFVCDRDLQMGEPMKAGINCFKGGF